MKHSPATLPLPRRFGNALRDNRPAIAALQWTFVVLYLVLLITPALFPDDDANTGALHTLGRFAEVLFWGVWWPGVILSVMLIGQFWCGLLCPDGTLTEFASRHGKGGKIPGWLRRPALPLATFAFITVFEYALQAHDTPRGTLLAVGTMTAFALACGAFLGRGKRVWCRYACPIGGLFSLLSRCAVLHFRVDRAAWDAAPRPIPKPVDCPALLDIRRLRSNEKCNMCGRCSDHRNAVALAWRKPGAEFAALHDGDARAWEAAGIVFVLIGLLYGALHWQHSPWHHSLLALGVSAVPAAFAAVLLPAIVLGSGTALLLAVASGGQRLTAIRLAYALIPLGGFGLFLGALEHALDILHDAGFTVAPLLPWLRAAVLLPATIWSTRAGCTILGKGSAARTSFGAGTAVLALTWQFAPQPLSA
ncbi:4Fe-4S binding protein [Aromatoleum toluclasticum]|uniref:4Fe-4S binding protein n=1 Tax=Aromatoleum toluclasticum TaxID=92003 RepID=UPI00037D47C3|nr:4Fe-4S binding protein [Aromatoleum toluclasticum]